MNGEMVERLRLEQEAYAICRAMRVAPDMIVVARMIGGYVVPRTWFDICLEDVRRHWRKEGRST